MIEPRFPDEGPQYPGERKNLAKSATRALDVLEYFAASRRPLRAIELAQALGYHTSSTDQLLKTMVDSGYLVFDPQRKLYCPSPRLARFSAWLGSCYYGAHRLSRLLAQVHTTTGAIVTLAVRQGDVAQVVDLLHTPGQAELVRNGVKVPLVGSALGMALLSAWPDERIAQAVQRIERTHKALQERVAQVLQDVTGVRRAGYACGGVAERIGQWSLAIPLPRAEAEVEMALGLAGSTEQVRPQQDDLARVMQRCVAQCLQGVPAN